MASQSLQQYLRSNFRLECAVCNHEVDELHSMRDVRTCTMKYLVRCHGQEQRVELSDFDVMNAGPDGIRIGRAFEFPQLENK